MSDDLISRQAAVEAVKKIINGNASYKAWAILHALKGMPSAERKTGRWIDGHCSICGCDVPAYIIDWRWQKDMDANYCPNCGAKMEVGE